MPARQSFADKAAIVGIGYTEFSRESGRPVLALALEAIDKALADAGLERSAVDGILSYALGDSVPVATVVSVSISRSFYSRSYSFRRLILALKDEFTAEPVRAARPLG